MDPDAVVVRASELESAAVDDDLVILNPDRNDYVALDAIGRRIWERLERPQPVRSLCAQLGEEFDGDPNQIAADVIAFLDELQGDGLISVVPASGL